MIRLITALSATAAIAVGAAALPAPAQAQAASSEVVVFGTDPCPRASDDQIVVCRRLPETMRYRLPENYRPSGTRQEKQAWANKARSMQNIGATGTNSCSAVGPGGFTGCLTQQIQQARRETRERNDQSVVPEE
ncbi:hypothetical protein [Sphingomonas sp. URHD0057]|uniref:hypothetical protein n=1 Tax=Sphingomonas sp. URHD0057 TaxID=1380389 RepID=UPI0006862AF1|nr:hypothetical protein [Sphingomonas sp. URHD0057]